MALPRRVRRFDGLDDRVPSLSDYEVQVPLKIYAIYEEAMRELGLEPLAERHVRVASLKEKTA